MTSTSTRQAVRRRASRAAGPANGKAAEPTAVAIATPVSAGTTPARKSGKAVPPARRPAHGRLVAIVALVFAFVATGVLGAAVAVMIVQKNNTEAVQARNQRFVDTAT
jgi:Mce-associated membrane protein